MNHCGLRRPSNITTIMVETNLRRVHVPCSIKIRCWGTITGLTQPTVNIRTRNRVSWAMLIA
ncbi:hypothetical protein HanHA89_Chr09g0340761 [Helianthus annuus]|nr:hypothetical protein HanHA89_Chr09g0340761 [Helianthus annuus]